MLFSVFYHASVVVTLRRQKHWRRGMCFAKRRILSDSGKPRRKNKRSKKKKQEKTGSSQSVKDPQKTQSILEKVPTAKLSLKAPLPSVKEVDEVSQKEEKVTFFREFQKLCKFLINFFYFRMTHFMATNTQWANVSLTDYPIRKTVSKSA